MHARSQDRHKKTKQTRVEKKGRYDMRRADKSQEQKREQRIEEQRGYDKKRKEEKRIRNG